MKDFDKLPEQLKVPVMVFSFLVSNGFIYGLAAWSYVYYGEQGFLTMIAASTIADYIGLKGEGKVTK